MTAHSETPRAAGIRAWVHAPEDRNERLTGGPAEGFAKTLRGKLQRNYPGATHWFERNSDIECNSIWANSVLSSVTRVQVVRGDGPE